jgi:hypothetical protein
MFNNIIQNIKIVHYCNVKWNINKFKFLILSILMLNIIILECHAGVETFSSLIRTENYIPILNKWFKCHSVLNKLIVIKVLVPKTAYLI